MTDVFAALGDATRRTVYERLAAGSTTATQLAAELPVTRQAVAKHLAVLEDAGLVRAERAGRERRFSPPPAPRGGGASARSRPRPHRWARRSRGWRPWAASGTTASPRWSATSGRG